jgi:hypothetical protein
MVGGMYRIFLLRQGKIAAHHEFSAENDAWRVARLRSHSMPAPILR